MKPTTTTPAISPPDLWQPPTLSEKADLLLLGARHLLELAAVAVELDGSRPELAASIRAAREPLAEFVQDVDIEPPLDGEEIYQLARMMLNTIPTNDQLAKLAGSLIGILDLSIVPQTHYRCDYCDEPGAYLAHWNTLPVPEPSGRCVCKAHLDMVSNCDTLGSFSYENTMAAQAAHR